MSGFVGRVACLGDCDHYTAFIQMPVILHEEVSEIVEAEIDFPVWYQPRSGDWLYHPSINGLMPLGLIFFDASRDTIVLTTIGSAYDFTTNLNEWLKGRPDWKKAPNPFIIQEKHDGTHPESGSSASPGE